MIDKHQKAMDEVKANVSDLVRDLNHLSEAGWSVLVEGQRDATALKKIGFRGTIASVFSVKRSGMKAFAGSKKVVILTDLDREGAVLASRYVKMLTHEGMQVSLAERRRLKHASHGVFLHVENLSRFGELSWPEVAS